MSIEKTIKEMLEAKNKKVVLEQVGADKVGDGPKDAPGQSESDEPNVSRNIKGQSAQAKSGLKKGSVKGDASKPEGKFPSNFSAPGQTREMVEGEEEGEVLTEVSIEEHLEAIFAGHTLTEEFKANAAIVFEAAVANRVKTEVASIEEAYEAALQEQFEETAEGLVEQVDGYLGLMVKKWLEDNELALESGMKNEILEGFVSGMKTLFAESYIDVPEEQLDVVAALEEEVEALRASLDESVSLNVQMNQALTLAERAEAVGTIAEGMTDVEAEKFVSLAEELIFEDTESFTKKLEVIRENYFTKKPTARVLTETVITDTQPDAEKAAPVLSESMARYVKALSNASMK